MKATDTLNQSDTQALSIVVGAALTITTNSLPDAEVGKTYGPTCTPFGRYRTLYLVRHAAPAGRPHLDVSTGKISGSSRGRDGRRLYPYLHRAGFVDTDTAN